MQTEIVDAITPNKYVHHGLWLGPQKPKRIFIYIHGLTSNLFSSDKLFPLINTDTSVLTFNHRGSEIVAKVKHLNPNHPKGYDSIVSGTAHEIFEDSVDDIEGAVKLCHDRGVKEVYLVGHSTGCQKAIFYLCKTKNKQKVSGAVLLCPMSDYASIPLAADKAQYEKALAYSRKEVKENRQDTLLAEEYWPSELIDAQRFLSLYTPESSEEIFTYCQDKEPETYRSVKVPVLVVLAEKDEYGDRPTEQLRTWFDENSSSLKYKSVVIQGALHNLKGYEDVVSKKIKDWISS